jgi:hypothetical protein
MHSVCNTFLSVFVLEATRMNTSNRSGHLAHALCMSQLRDISHLFPCPIILNVSNLIILFCVIITNSVDFSPQANYTDRAAASCRRN